MLYLTGSKRKISHVKDMVQVFRDVLALEDQIGQEKEHYYVMHLTTRSWVKMVELVTVGY